MNELDLAIEKALAEEQVEPTEAIKQMNNNTTYLDKNLVTMSLSEYLKLHEAEKHLNKLVDSLLDVADLNYNKDKLKADYNTEHVYTLIKEIAPLKYVEKYEHLLEE